MHYPLYLWDLFPSFPVALADQKGKQGPSNNAILWYLGSFFHPPRVWQLTKRHTSPQNLAFLWSYMAHFGLRVCSSSTRENEKKSKDVVQKEKQIIFKHLHHQNSWFIAKCLIHWKNEIHLQASRSDSADGWKVGSWLLFASPPR